MVICNECGTRIAPKVTVCPKCGANVDATNAGPPKRARKPVPWGLIVVLGAAFALASAAAYLLLR
ncbi:MAG TPA: zinc ribbon domain-containing protein [Polyangia bacterium]|nr:zinc ribbon domain-containing protein [Polyangia bacterium]